jgi:thymidylate synthase (FAD)
MKVTLLTMTENAEALIAMAARVSRRGDHKLTTTDEDRLLIGRLIRDGHESVLEHASAAFLIEGISRCCLAQLTRHRLASFTVETQRLDRIGGYPARDFVHPRSVEKCGAMIKADEAACACIAAYDALIKEGVPAEDARYYLPQGVTTRLVMTANFREWRHIIRLRTAPDAQWEIREVADRIRETLNVYAPSVFKEE